MGQLKAKVGGAWVPIGTGPPGVVYYTNRTTMIAASAPTMVGTIAVTGNLTPADGNHAPRRWMWTGAAWQFIDWWGAEGRPGVLLGGTSSQPIATGASVQVTWASDVRDIDGWHPPGTSAPVNVPAGWSGVYAITCTVRWASSFYADTSILCSNNGVGLAGIQGSTANAIATLGFQAYLTAADVLVFTIFQGSGAAKNFTGSLFIDWLGP